MNSIPSPTHKLDRKFNTLQIIRFGLYASWGVSLIFLVLSIYTKNLQQQAIKTVGIDAAPSILTAQQLRDSFADIDASLANELLLKPGENTQALADFEKNQKKIADRLVAAARNITYPAEEKIVQTLQLKGSDYLLKLQEARDHNRRGDKVGALTAYRSAASLMDSEILPEAEKLDRVNSQELENTYTQQGFYNGALALLVALVGLLQIGILVLIQIFIFQRMRRIFNLPLLAASAISILFLGYTLNAIVGAATNLKIAKEDAFDSIHNIRQARALSYMANADESRYLLDTIDAQKHDRAFKAKIDKLITVPQGKSLKDVIDTIPKQGNQKFQLNGLTGFYAEQLKNITFDDELPATVDALTKLDNYLTIDTQIRQLYRSGKIAEAIALCTGNNPGQSNEAFEKYRNANQAIKLINEKAFDRHINAGFDLLDPFGIMGYKSSIVEQKNSQNFTRSPIGSFEIIAFISIGSIAMLTLFGLRPRLAEYL
jgi:hypothetical protein